MSYVCGFNLFEQLKRHRLKSDNCGNECFVSEGLIFLEGVRILHFSWSGFLYLRGNELCYKGLVNGKREESITLIPPSGESVIKGVCRGDVILVVDRSGVCWSYNLPTARWTALRPTETHSPPTEGHPSRRVIDLAASPNITLLLTEIGEALCYPSLVSGVDVKVTQVACGVEHSAFLTDSGYVYTWGSSSRGQLGHGDIDSRDEPTELAALAGIRVVQIAAGSWHTCALTKDGDLYAWGWNHCGQLGIDISDCGKVVTKPELVKLNSEYATVKSVACGTTHTVILLEDGSVWGSGCNRWGQLSGVEVGSGETIQAADDAAPTDILLTRFSLVYRPTTAHPVTSIVASHWNTALVL